MVHNTTSVMQMNFEELKEKLEKVSGNKISLLTKINPSLVAGLKVEIEGVELDGTVSGRLNDISKKLSETII